MFKLLSCTEDAAEWDRLFEALPPELQDVHFTSAYARVQLFDGKPGEGYLAVFGDKNGAVLLPLRWRPINGGPYSDIMNLYGYGGPLMIGDSEPWRLSWHRQLHKWATDNGVVCEFQVLHPLLLDYQFGLLRHGPVNIVFTKDVVVIDDLKQFNLTKVSRRVRRGVVRGACEDRVLFSEGRAWFTFARLYEQSMARLDGAERWRFSEDYWWAHMREKGVDARIFFIDQDKRALLTVGHGSTAYAHFLGSNGADLHEGLDELLYYNAAQVLAEKYDRFHLGGGLTESVNDSLLFFKRGFSDRLYRVGTYSRVFMPDVYENLIEVKKWEERKEFGRESTQPWFPQYRREFA